MLWDWPLEFRSHVPAGLGFAEFSIASKAKTKIQTNCDIRAEHASLCINRRSFSALAFHIQFSFLGYLMCAIRALRCFLFARPAARLHVRVSHFCSQLEIEHNNSCFNIKFVVRCEQERLIEFRRQNKTPRRRFCEEDRKRTMSPIEWKLTRAANRSSIIRFHPFLARRSEESERQLERRSTANGQTFFPLLLCFQRIWRMRDDKITKLE